MAAMRPAALPLLLLAASAAPVRAQERPVRPPHQIAAEAVEALDRGDTAKFAELAALPRPGAWTVADHILQLGRADVAKALAEASKDEDRAALVAYIEREGALAPDERARDAVAAANVAFQRRDFEGVLAALDGVAGRGLAGIWVLNGRFHALRYLGRAEAAEGTAAETAEAALALGWLAYADAMFGNAAGMAQARGDTGRWREMAERVVAVRERSGDKAMLAGAQINLGIALERGGATADARALYERGIALAREAGQRQFAANGLVNLGSMLARLGERAPAEAALREGLAMQRESGNLPFEANALESLADLLSEGGALDEARALVEAAVAIRERLGAKQQVAANLRKLGDLAHAQREPEDASRFFAEALRISVETGDRRSEMFSSLGLAREMAEAASYAPALEHARRAAELATALADDHASLFARTILGNTYARVGDLDRALGLLRAVRDETREKEPKKFAQTVANVGYVHLCRGEYGEALQHSLEARRLAMQENNEALANESLNNIGSCYLGLGDLERGLATLKACAEAAARDSADVAGQASALINLGGAHWALGETDEAASLFERGLALAVTSGAKLWEFNARTNLGLIEAARDRPAAAIAIWTAARARIEELGMPHLAASLESYIASELLETGDTEGALAHAQTARALAAEGVSGIDQAMAAYHLGKVLLATGKPSEALGCAAEAALALGRSVRGVPVTAAVRGDSLWRSLLQLGIEGATGAGEIEAAFAICERARAGQMLEALGGRDARHTGSVPPALAAEEAERRTAVLIARARVEEALGTRKRDAVRAARADLDAAQAAYLDFVGRLQLQATAASSVLFPDPVAVGALRQRLGPRAAYVGYAVLDERCMAFVVLPDALRLVDLGPVEEQVRALVEADASELGDDNLEAARRLLWVPLALPSELRHVVVTPDGEMSALPFQAFVNGQTVSLVGSATIYTLLARAGDGGAQRVLALGDPAYGDGASKLARLPATRAEAEAVGDLVLLGDRATEEGLLDAIAKEPRWRAIHLACHGLADARQPMHSALALAPHEGSDGLLTVVEIYGRRVPADLVVLSACESGRGRVYGTEGAIGFPSAFLLAGAKSVVASLWKVDDEATSTLMAKFYALWRPKDGSAGAGPAEALRAAQQHVRSQQKWRHPQFWAAWQLWGIGG